MTATPIITYSLLAHVPLDKIQKSIDGRWYQLSPRTYIVKADNNRYSVVTLNCFERLKAAFLKIFGVNYFAKILSAKEVTILDRVAMMTKEPESVLKARSEHERAFCDFAIKKVESQYYKKKMCLLLSCAHTKVPQKADENWIWVSDSDNKTKDANIVHLKLKSDDPNYKYLHGVFDKVVVGCCGKKEWKPLHALLKKNPEAEIIMWSPHEQGTQEEIYKSEDDLRNRPIDYADNAKKGRVVYPTFVPSIDKQKEETYKQEAIKKTIVKMEEHLKTMFHHVTFESKKNFPGNTEKLDFFVLKGPKPILA